MAYKMRKKNAWDIKRQQGKFVKQQKDGTLCEGCSGGGGSTAVYNLESITDEMWIEFAKTNNKIEVYRVLIDDSISIASVIDYRTRKREWDDDCGDSGVAWELEVYAYEYALASINITEEQYEEINTAFLNLVTA